MYGAEFWENNLIKLSDKVSEEEILLPVFFEELKAVGLDEYFNFPECKEPLAWVKDKGGAYLLYYYDGELLAKVKKPSGFFGVPKVVYTLDSVKELKPVDLQELTEVNHPFLQKLEEEAKEYIKEKEKKFKKRSSFIAVSYSGGKDSQVVLDLVFQVLHVGEFVTLFTDTGMELPPTYEVVKETERFYRDKNPEFRIEKAQIAGVLEEFLSNANLKIQDKEVTMVAIRLFKATSLDFVDCLLCAYSKKMEVFSFDRKLNKYIQKL
jgi:phosphoadenosine phosphosulfate reductase